ncbi:hypothetical protein Acr_15g0001190 [Actinidia rufa]|uniref:Retrotransposon gag domain-containing protein n=1 Tax=Actinidia rufa TaxID=165716 RepID=A0A7J0FTM6_9ERIC|nr:hypothetical protein Acr_15g0001190 [Actinidia rufa]
MHGSSSIALFDFGQFTGDDQIPETSQSHHRFYDVELRKHLKTRYLPPLPDFTSVSKAYVPPSPAACLLHAISSPLFSFSTTSATICFQFLPPSLYLFLSLCRDLERENSGKILRENVRSPTSKIRLQFPSQESLSWISASISTVPGRSIRSSPPILRLRFYISSSEQPFSPLWAFSDDNGDTLAGDATSTLAGGHRLSPTTLDYFPVWNLAELSRSSSSRVALSGYSLVGLGRSAVSSTPLGEVARVVPSRCLPKPSASSSLDNRAHPMANTSQAPDLEGLYREIHDLDACLDAINTGAGIPVTVDTLLPPRTIDSFGDLSRLFVANFMSCRIRQKNASHLFTVHQKETESLKEYVKRFNQAILEVEDPSDKVVIMAMMEGLRLGPLFDSLSKSVLETLSALQNKANKYIAVEELAEAKRRWRGKDDPKRKEPDSRRPEYRDEARSKRSNRDSRRTNERCPRTPPRRPELIMPLSMLPSPRAEEEIYNLFSPFVDTHPPITFNNDDLRANILFISAFDKMKIGLDKLNPHHVHNPLVGFGGNTTHPLGWIKLPVTLGTEPHQITVWQDFIVVDCPSPYNAILGRPTLGGTRAITSTYTSR